VKEGTPSFQLCDAFQASIQDVYLIDIDGSLGPPLENTTGVASLVGKNRDMRTFIPEEKCSERDGCYFYCIDTCLRTVSFSVDPALTQDYKLRVCERANLEKCVLYDGHNYTEWNGVASQAFALYSKHYYAALPAGQYEAVFLDANGKKVWPTFAETTYHDASCQGGVEDGMIWLQKPPPAQNECSMLLRNGNAEADGTSHLDWVAGAGGIQVVQDAGMGSTGQVSSQAFCDISPDVANNTYFVGQYIDTRCLIQDRLYTVEAWVRISDVTTEAWVGISDAPIVTDCNTNSECPKVGIHFVGKLGVKWTFDLDSSDNIFSSQSSTGRYHADFDGGYQRFTGIFRVDMEMAYADSAFFYLTRNDTEDGSLCVDNVSIVLT
jgi:Pyruvate/2-oxoacid:ferredoxin oxidoreductase delta subunit